RVAVAAGCPGVFRPPSPPPGGAPARHDQAGQSSTGEGTGTRAHAITCDSVVETEPSSDAHSSSDRLDSTGKQSGGILPSGEPSRGGASVRGEPPPFSRIADQTAQCPCQCSRIL